MLARRIADRIERCKRDPSHPWVGLGLVRDLESIMQLLNLPEFAEWLRLHGGEHAVFADEILTLQSEHEANEDAADKAEGEAGDAQEALADIRAAIDEHVPRFAAIDDEPPAETIKRAGNLLADIRVVLVERGALANDDHETELPALIGALLS